MRRVFEKNTVLAYGARDESPGLLRSPGRLQGDRGAYLRKYHCLNLI